MKEIADLQMKVITSSQPPPPRKSSSKKPRRETNPSTSGQLLTPSTHSVHNSYKVKEDFATENHELHQRISSLSMKFDESERKMTEQIDLIRELESSKTNLQEELDNIKLSSSLMTSFHAQQFQEIQSKLSLANEENQRRSTPFYCTS